jgi:hypothetical protein
MDGYLFADDHLNKIERSIFNAALVSLWLAAKHAMQAPSSSTTVSIS